MGNSFIEAMAAKVPVLATPVGGIIDFLHDGKTGYLCNPSDSKSIADGVNRVISDPEKDSVIINAYNLVKEKYSWDIVAMQMKSVFDNLSSK
jgi:D-inositol-3-phosphate glycosyltransferase